MIPGTPPLSSPGPTSPLDPAIQPISPVQPIPVAPWLTGMQGRKAASRGSDPLLAYQFSVDFTIDPFGFIPFFIPITGYFMEISGLDVEWETAEYKSTNMLGLPHSNFVPLRPIYHPIVLKRGVTDNEGIYLWHQLLALGAKPLLKSYVMITMYNRSYEMVAQFSVERCWPSKISGPQFRADSSDILIEELTLTHGGIYRMYLNPAFMLLDVAMQMMLP
jgi:phage tail-like protein